MYLRARVHNTG